MRDQAVHGDWVRGQEFIVGAGPHMGHLAQVVNPSLEQTRSLTKGTFDTATHTVVQETRTGPVECVLVRCKDCFDSWTFASVAEIDDTLPTGEDEERTMRLVWEMLGGEGDE